MSDENTPMSTAHDPGEEAGGSLAQARPDQDAGQDEPMPVAHAPDDPHPAPSMDMPMVKRIVEAALLAASQPMGTRQLADLFPEGEAPSHQILQQALEALAGDCEGRGVELVEVASGYRYQVRGEVYPWVSRLWTERQTRYGRAVLETLALIAYRQPITRGEIESVRGVAVSTNIIRTLEERDWIRVVGHRDVPGKPALLGTTRGFLDYFGLKSLDQLPPLAELRDIPDLEPELPFDGDKAPAVAHVTTGEDTPADDGQDPGADTGPDTEGTVAMTDAPTPEETAAPVDDDDARPEQNNP